MGTPKEARRRSEKRGKKTLEKMGVPLPMDGNDPSPSNTDGLKDVNIPIANLRPNRYQPRISYTEEEMDSLRASIRKHGVIGPIGVVKLPEPEGTITHEIAFGERRYRAALQEGLDSIPVRVLQNISAKEMMVLPIIENALRKDLNPVEIAVALGKLREKFPDMRTEDIAEMLCVSIRSVQQYMNIAKALSVNEEIKVLFESQSDRVTFRTAYAFSKIPHDLIAAHKDVFVEAAKAKGIKAAVAYLIRMISSGNRKDNSTEHCISRKTRTHNVMEIRIPKDAELTQENEDSIRQRLDEFLRTFKSGQ